MLYCGMDVLMELLRGSWADEEYGCVVGAAPWGQEGGTLASCIYPANCGTFASNSKIFEMTSVLGDVRGVLDSGEDVELSRWRIMAL